MDMKDVNMRDRGPANADANLLYKRGGKSSGLRELVFFSFRTTERIRIDEKSALPMDAESGTARATSGKVPSSSVQTEPKYSFSRFARSSSLITIASP